MYLREIVRDGKCEVNGRHENVGFRIRGGDFIEIELDPSRETAMRPEDVALDILFEDEHIVVVNKPSGMLVHPTHRDKSGTLLNALSFHLNGQAIPSASAGGQAFAGNTTSEDLGFLPPANAGGTASIRPGLVHRLDKQTSGLIVVAKSVRAHRLLARQFQRKLVEKKYVALVEGLLSEQEGTIEGTIGRYADEKRWDIKHDGKHSETRYRVLRRHSDTTLLELEPVTGRTNQLRIHCASIGHPIVGDVNRGGREFHRLCLHAQRIAFRHPATNERIEFETQIDFGTQGNH